MICLNRSSKYSGLISDKLKAYAGNIPHRRSPASCVVFRHCPGAAGEKEPMRWALENGGPGGRDGQRETEPKNGEEEEQVGVGNNRNVSPWKEGGKALVFS